MSDEREQAQELIAGFYIPLIQAQKSRVSEKRKIKTITRSNLRQIILDIEIQAIEKEITENEKAVQQISLRWKI